jgi:peptidoglycan/LPS O-acetylase OafA/YrhL
MIQRIQTIWLFLAALSAALTFQFAFYSGNVLGPTNLPVYEEMRASSNFLTLIFTAGLIVGCIILIFLYKNRKQQLWITAIAAGLSMVNIIIYFTGIKKYTNGNISLGAALAFLIPIFLLLAARGIWKDEKLVKSLDRLR